MLIEINVICLISVVHLISNMGIMYKDHSSNVGLYNSL